MNTLQTDISEAREYFLQKKTESSTQDTYKNLELTAKIAARQEYSTGISEAQEYSKRWWSMSLSHTRMLGSNKYSSKQN